MIDYIGDLSKADAQVLREYAQISKSILEFGSGASTQILRAYSNGIVASVETEQGWINSTQKHIRRLGLTKEVIFIPWAEFVPTWSYDLVFNDGPLELRRHFAAAVWNRIALGGWFLYHDTRTTRVVKDVASLFEDHSPEIHTMIVNQNHSNITAVLKKSAEFYENWNLIEGKAEWQIGR